MLITECPRKRLSVGHRREVCLIGSIFSLSFCECIAIGILQIQDLESFKTILPSVLIPR